MSRVLRLTCLLTAALAASWAQDQPLQTKKIQPNRLVPSVSSPYSVVDRMLELSGIKPGQTLYDLGCGDGRILVAAVQKYRVKAVGVDISPFAVKGARENIQKSGVQDLASVIEDDLMKVDLSPADVVTLYLSSDFNAELRPNLEKYLKPGTRVVSYDYPIAGWKPQYTERAETRSHKQLIYVYTMPPQR